MWETLSPRPPSHCWSAPQRYHRQHLRRHRQSAPGCANELQSCQQETRSLSPVLKLFSDVLKRVLQSWRVLLARVIKPFSGQRGFRETRYKAGVHWTKHLTRKKSPQSPTSFHDFTNLKTSAFQPFETSRIVHSSACHRGYSYIIERILDYQLPLGCGVAFAKCLSFPPWSAFFCDFCGPLQEASGVRA